MPDIIHLLPDTVANQIAAGEVIQRPASVVKELVENAIDAGSTVITVNVKDGGKTLIQVTDNGCGMSDTDIRMSFERHATSKIHDAGDLFSIHTLGFRGEALASVASVSQVTVRTCKPGNELGSELIIAGSVVESQKAVACQAGTNFSIRNLFYNVPARRKFLKSINAELKHIIHELQRVAIANPKIEFRLDHNNSEVYNLPRTNIKQRIVHIFGKNINQNLTEINTDTSIVSIRGFIGKPEFARRTPGEQFFFVNNRYMKHPYFHKAVLSAYEKILPPETIPSYFIFFNVDPATIDVNIHPTKTEIKFENELAVFQILTAATREALGKFSIVPSIDFNTEGAFEIPLSGKNIPVSHPKVTYDPFYNPFNTETDSGKNLNGPEKDNIHNWEKLYASYEASAINPGHEYAGQSSIILPENKQDLVIQLRNKYVITPVKSGLMVIDQKRAHERILYEQYIHSFAMNYPVAQQTLFPETIELDQADYLLIKEILDDLQIIGFDIRDFGSNTVVVAGYPANSGNDSPRELIETFLAQYKITGTDIKISVRDNVARSLAVAGSVGYGKTLSQHMMQELVDRLFACESPGYSPSGKPVVVILPVEELEKKFR